MYRFPAVLPLSDEFQNLKIKLVLTGVPRESHYLYISLREELIESQFCPLKLNLFIS